MPMHNLLRFKEKRKQTMNINILRRSEEHMQESVQTMNINILRRIEEHMQELVQTMNINILRRSEEHMQESVQTMNINILRRIEEHMQELVQTMHMNKSRRRKEELQKLSQILNILNNKAAETLQGQRNLPNQEVRQQSLGYTHEDTPLKECDFQKKRHTLIKACEDLYEKNSASIREVAKVLCQIESILPSVEYGRLYYRDIKREKKQALEMLNDNSVKRNHDQFMAISAKMKVELKWWIDLPSQVQPKPRGNPDKIIICDAGPIGWGAVCCNAETKDKFTDEESGNNQNYRELLAAYYAVKYYGKDSANMHVQIKSDNPTPVAYINNMGGLKEQYDLLARSLWLWGIEKNIWLSAIQIPGESNVADALSRSF